VKVAVAVIASVLALVGNASYVKSTLRGKTKPHPYSWFVWTIVSLTTFVGGVQKGAGVGAIPTGIAELFTVVVFAIALWRLVKGRDVEQINKKVDTIFLVVALLGLAPWILTKDPTISVVTVVTIDLLAFIPTVRKTWLHPETESPLLYGANVARHVLTLIALWGLQRRDEAVLDRDDLLEHADGDLEPRQKTSSRSVYGPVAPASSSSMTMNAFPAAGLTVSGLPSSARPLPRHAGVLGDSTQLVSTYALRAPASM
jgi:hypothetical protein